MTAYRVKTYLVPQSHEDALTAELWARGVLGCEIGQEEDAEGRLRLDAYFPDPLPPEMATWDLSEWRSKGVSALAETALEDRDWLEEYRSAAKPIEVGHRFVVDPRDEDDPPPDDPSGRFLLRIPARTAFGTGSHESTRLAVEWLEELELTGLDVLDVGTGSGILCFVALRLGARRAVGFDVDPPSALVARQNGRLNDARPLLYAGRLAALRDRPAFDLALVNVLPERILDDVPELLKVLRPRARVVSSGNLTSRRRELLDRFASLGLASIGEKRDGDWTAFLLRS